MPAIALIRVWTNLRQQRIYVRNRRVWTAVPRPQSCRQIWRM